MLIHQLSTEQCHDVLSRNHLGRLACARADQPYIVPIFFDFDLANYCLYSFSTVGQKIEWMRENPKVCVEVDEIADQFHWTTVVVIGRYEEVAESGREDHPRQRVQKLFEQRPEWWLPGAGKLAAGEEHHVPVVYRIRIKTMSGRRAARPPGTDV
jgi:nitroimidazol reductase NimA-like FMN-containing flavoprotein (pyridoxamine 5'-phosphate oxidase superfamily)